MQDEHKVVYLKYWCSVIHRMQLRSCKCGLVTFMLFSLQDLN